jgi:hypothetical protein
MKRTLDKLACFLFGHDEALHCSYDADGHDTLYICLQCGKRLD